jgi:hypothetical protein
MADAVSIGLALALFAASGLYVRACAHLTGTSTATSEPSDGDRS